MSTDSANKELDESTQEDIVAISKILHRKLSSNNFTDNRKKKDWLICLQSDIDNFNGKEKDYTNKAAVRRLKLIINEVITEYIDLKKHVLGLLSKRKYDTKNKTIKVDKAIHKKFLSLKKKGRFDNASELLKVLIETHKKSL